MTTHSLQFYSINILTNNEQLSTFNLPPKITIMVRRTITREYCQCTVKSTGLKCSRLAKFTRRASPTDSTLLKVCGYHTTREQGSKKVEVKVVDNEERETCSICLCDIEDDKNVFQTDCGHRFHRKCLSKWIKTSHSLEDTYSCPNCRSVFTIDSAPPPPPPGDHLPPHLQEPSENGLEIYHDGVDNDNDNDDDDDDDNVLDSISFDLMLRELMSEDAYRMYLLAVARSPIEEPVPMELD